MMLIVAVTGTFVNKLSTSSEDKYSTLSVDWMRSISQYDYICNFVMIIFVIFLRLMEKF